MSLTVELPCFCGGHLANCTKCAGSGVVTKPACPRCKGKGDIYGRMCSDCRGRKEAMVIFDEGEAW